MQKEIDERVTGSQLFNGKELFSDLKTDIRKRLRVRIEALQELRNAVEGDHDGITIG